MSIKGLKEALAKKQKSQNPEQQADDPDAKIIRTGPMKVTANKPQKRVTGRGR